MDGLQCVYVAQAKWELADIGEENEQMVYCKVYI